MRRASNLIAEHAFERKACVGTELGADSEQFRQLSTGLLVAYRYVSCLSQTRFERIAELRVVCHLRECCSANRMVDDRRIHALIGKQVPRLLYVRECFCTLHSHPTNRSRAHLWPHLQKAIGFALREIH